MRSEKGLNRDAGDELDMVIVTTSYPFWLEHNDRSWKQEKAIIAMVSEFIGSVPDE